MPAFDPVAATAAYMATLTPAQHARATAYTHGGEWLLLWNWIVAILAFTVMTRTRLLPRLSGWIDPQARHPVRVTAICIAAFTAPICPTGCSGARPA